MIHRIDIAGFALQLELLGSPIRVAGHYTAAAAGAVLMAELSVEVRPDFSEGKSAKANFPAFDVAIEDAKSLRLSRYDAEGTIQFQPGEPIRASFVLAEREVALEALIRIVSSYALLRHDALVLHSSAIGDSTGAHVFSGVSGAGKSTIASMLCSHWSVRQLSDELLILRRIPGKGWHLVVSPFLGSKGLPHGEQQPLVSINFLLQADTNQRRPLTAREALPELYRHILSYARDAESSEMILNLVTDLVQDIDCYELKFLKSPSVGELFQLTATSKAS